MKSIWGHLLLLIAIGLATALVIIALPHDEDEPVEPVDDAHERYLELMPYITPYNYMVVNTTIDILGLNWDKNLTDIDITLIQDWMARNLQFVQGQGINNPNETLTTKSGTHLSLSLVEYSMFLYEGGEDLDSYLLLVDLMYDGDEAPRNHSATLTFFGSMVYLSDVTLPIDKLNYVCRLNPPERCLSDIIVHTYVTEYDVKYALSKNSQESFDSNQDFYVWLAEKTGTL